MIPPHDDGARLEDTPTRRGLDAAYIPEEVECAGKLNQVAPPGKYALIAACDTETNVYANGQRRYRMHG